MQIVAAKVAGFLMLCVALVAIAYNMFLFAPESTVGGVTKAVVVALVAAATLVTASGYSVGSRGDAALPWMLYGLAGLMHVLWLVVLGDG